LIVLTLAAQDFTLRGARRGLFASSGCWIRREIEALKRDISQIAPCPDGSLGRAARH